MFVAASLLVLLSVTPAPQAARICAPTAGVVQVTACGATGNGTTDDTAAIQAAISAVSTRREIGGGGTVSFPPGIFLVSAPLTVASHNVSLVGAGPKATYLITSPGFAPGEAVVRISHESVPTSVQFAAVKNLGIELTVSSAVAVRAVLSRNLVVEDVFVTGPPDPDSTSVGIQIDGGSAQGGYYAAFTQIHRAYLQRLKYGIELQNQVTRTWITNNTLVGGSVNGSAGIKLPHMAGGVVIEANEIESWTDGIWSEAHHVNVAFNDFESNASHHVNFVDTQPDSAFFAWVLGNHYFGLPAGWLIGLPHTPNAAVNLINLFDVDTMLDAPGMDIAQMRYGTFHQEIASGGRWLLWGVPDANGYQHAVTPKR
jgi:hypothetical protein